VGKKFVPDHPCGRKAELKVLLLGIDGCGTTTLLYRIKLGETVSSVPTIGFNVETVELNGRNLTIWDIGG
jgi:GTPase SAR1 family protein